MTTPKIKQVRRLAAYALLLLLVSGYLFFVRCGGGGFGCFFYDNFQVTCPSCGATRAFMALIRLDFSAAAAYNPVFAFAIYPIAGLVALQDILLCIDNLRSGRDRISFLQFLFGRRDFPAPEARHGREPLS